MHKWYRINSTISKRHRSNLPIEHPTPGDNLAIRYAMQKGQILRCKCFQTPSITRVTIHAMDGLNPSLYLLPWNNSRSLSDL
ncbi:hypothetical protein VTL71DRAFT_4589 [Oculimacula yallundae]|uniref:Uncharacterized protein n=1 Tax=Oculimacula yallundae TaxID=86028 RepID=A0ABR4C2F2_9HELO